MTLTVRLNEEDEFRLQQIVEAMNVGNQSDAIRQIIEEKWIALQTNRTFVERRGGHPHNLLAGNEDDSDRASRKSRLAAHLEQKAAARIARNDAKDAN
ncbi:MAG: hypothetical protein SGJ27_09835 [Candidatus Melainabacteria bacterium]|nr:hypothetical protein [Candidatus Melainabacteria bacterium]